MRKIIIPAAGKAERFNGVLKELIGINPYTNATALGRTIHLAVHRLHATHIVLITNEEKQAIHTEYIESIAHYFPDTIFNIVLQSDDRDLLGAIITGITVDPRYMPGGLLLPDTITDFDAIPEDVNNIAFGLFTTQEPERFSIVFNGTIYTKESGFPERPQGYSAWGVVLWDSEVAHKMLMFNHLFATYDALFQHIMTVFGSYSTFDLKYYYDIGTYEKYVEYLGDIQ